MANLFASRKVADESVSPLMADDPSVTASVSSSRSRSSKKSSKSALTQAEQDEKDVKLGCCYTFGGLLVKSIHVIDALLGLLFIIYGALIITHFSKPAMAAAITCLTLGSVLLFAAIMGLIGFHTKVCRRIGLVISAYTAPFIALFYLSVTIAVLAATDTFFKYLILHKDVLYLSADQIKTLKDLLPFFYIILLVLGTVEMARFWGLRKIREKLIKHDVAWQHISERSRYGPVGVVGESGRSGLSEYLLCDEDA